MVPKPLPTVVRVPSSATQAQLPLAVMSNRPVGEKPFGRAPTGWPALGGEPGVRARDAWPMRYQPLTVIAGLTTIRSVVSPAMG